MPYKACVGCIANPMAGKDIRRLVAYSSRIDNQEKVNIVRRILLGLESAGVAGRCASPTRPISRAWIHIPRWAFRRCTWSKTSTTRW